MQKLGAHVSIAGGYDQSLNRIKAIGGNCLQIFSSSPRGWNFVKLEDKQTGLFRTKKKELRIDPVYFHASYLLNLASPGRIGQLSTQHLTHELKTASKLGIKGSVIHLGSYIDHTTRKEKYKILLEHIGKVLLKTPRDTLFIIENAGTRKIGLHIDEIAEIIQDLKDKRIKICLDTCHLHAAGYDLRTEKSFAEFLEVLDAKIGMNKLEVWHANDSRDHRGSYRDRHENIGEGLVGIEVFKNILNHPKTKNLPCIIETPGFDDNGPDQKNLNILKSLTRP